MNRQTESNHDLDAPLIRVVQGLLAAVLAFQLLYFGLYSWTMIKFPGQLDYGEGPILQLALRVARGQSLYPPLNQGYPYAIASYLPFYYLLCAGAARLTGPSFAGGRLLSALAALAIATAVGLLVHRRTGSRWAGTVAAASILAIPVFLVWATLMRIDMVGLACSVAGLCLFDRGRRLAGIVLMALGVFTRWTNLAPIAAALGGLLLQRRWRAAVGWGAAQLAVIASLILAAHLVTRGGMFEQLRWHTLTSLGKSWSWFQVYDLLYKGWKHWPVYYVLSVAGTLWCLARPQHWPLALWSLGAWAIYLTSGRVGSTYNYFLEPFAAGMACTGILLAEGLSATRTGGEHSEGTRPRGQPIAPPAALRALALAVMGSLALQMVHTSVHRNETLQVIRPYADAQSSLEVVEALRRAPGMVMCEDVGLIELAGREVPFDPFEFTMLSRAGAIDPRPVLEDIRQGRFSLFVTRLDMHRLAAQIGNSRYAFAFDRFPEEMVLALVQRYELAAVRQPYYLYVPRREMSPG